MAEPAEFEVSLVEQRRMFAFDQAMSLYRSDGLEKVIAQAKLIEWYLAGDETAPIEKPIDDVVVRSGDAPPGYRRLPDGARCRCIKMHIRPDGVGFCCRS